MGAHLEELGAKKKCQFFMWLALHNRCWTADRLAQRGLDHPNSCVLCDQAEGDMQHILLGCVFARQIWFHLFHSVDLSVLAPQADDSFMEWWVRTDKLVPNVQRTLKLVDEEGHLWCLAGAKELARLPVATG